MEQFASDEHEVFVPTCWYTSLDFVNVQVLQSLKKVNAAKKMAKLRLEEFQVTEQQVSSSCADKL